MHEPIYWRITFSTLKLINTHELHVIFKHQTEQGAWSVGTILTRMTTPISSEAQKFMKGITVKMI